MKDNIEYVKLRSICTKIDLEMRKIKVYSKNINNKSKISTLNTCVDKNNILRIGVRLNNSGGVLGY